MNKLIALCIAVTVQATLLARYDLRGAVPSAVVALLVIFATRMPPPRAALYAAFAGFLEDALCGSGLCWTVSTALIAFAIAWLARRIVVDAVVLYALIGALACGLRDGIFWTLQGIAGYPGGLEFTHLHMSLWRMVSTAFLTAVFAGMRRRAATGYAR